MHSIKKIFEEVSKLDRYLSGPEIFDMFDIKSEATKNKIRQRLITGLNGYSISKLGVTSQSLYKIHKGEGREIKLWKLAIFGIPLENQNA